MHTYIQRIEKLTSVAQDADIVFIEITAYPRQRAGTVLAPPVKELGLLIAISIYLLVTFFCAREFLRRFFVHYSLIMQRRLRTF